MWTEIKFNDVIKYPVLSVLPPHYPLFMIVVLLPHDCKMAALLLLPWLSSRQEGGREERIVRTCC